VPDIDINDVNDRAFYDTLQELIDGYMKGFRVTDLLDTSAIRYVCKKRIVELERLKGRQRDIELCKRFLEILEKEDADKKKK